MAKYTVNYKCGHEGTIQLYGKHTERERKLEWMSGNVLCEDCQKIEFEKQNALAAMENKSAGLPELIGGTEKQRTWAESLRAECHKALHVDSAIVSLLRIVAREKKVTEDELKASSITTPETARALMTSLRDKLFTEQTYATFWINNRPEIKRVGDLYDWDKVTDRLVAQFVDALKATIPSSTPPVVETPAPQTAPEAPVTETVYPEKPITESIVKIETTDAAVMVEADKNETLRTLVKARGFEWDGNAWTRKITLTTGTAFDRAAELGNQLLEKGFPLRSTPEIVKAAVAGTFTPECTRWVYKRSKGDFAGWFALQWNRSDDLYAKAKKLPSAKWDNGSMLVKPEQYQAVEEFARLFGFQITPAAQMILDAAKATREAAKVVTPAHVEPEQPKDGLKDILKSSEAVLDDLRD